MTPGPTPPNTSTQSQTPKANITFHALQVTTQPLQAIETAAGPHKDARLGSWKEVLKARKAMCINFYHSAAHVLRPSFLLNQLLEDIPIVLKESLRRVMKDFASFGPTPEAEVDAAMKLWSQIVNKEGAYTLHDDAASIREMWKEAGLAHKLGRDDKRWWQMHIGSQDRAKLLFCSFEHLNDLRPSEAGCERAYSVIAHVQEGRAGIPYDKLEQLTHIFWAYRTMQSGHHASRMKKLEAIMRAAQTDLEHLVDDERDAEYQEFAVDAEAHNREVQEALEISPDEYEPSSADSPMQGHAEIAGPKLLDLHTLIEGMPMRTALAVTPIIEEMGRLTVTAKTLSKQLVPLLKTLRQYKAHDDVVLAMRVKQLVGAWRTIHMKGAHSNHFCARDLLEPGSSSASSLDRPGSASG